MIWSISSFLDSCGIRPGCPVVTKSDSRVE
jgi:hypothetical protein